MSVVDWIGYLGGCVAVAYILVLVAGGVGRLLSGGGRDVAMEDVMRQPWDVQDPTRMSAPWDGGRDIHPSGGP